MLVYVLFTIRIEHLHLDTGMQPVFNTAGSQKNATVTPFGHSEFQIQDKITVPFFRPEVTAAFPGQDPILISPAA